METHVFIPWVRRCRTARQRLLQAFGPDFGATTVVACFEASVEECRRLGLMGNGLIVAAEHMASTRLRAGAHCRPGVLVPA